MIDQKNTFMIAEKLSPKFLLFDCNKEPVFGKKKIYFCFYRLNEYNTKCN